MKRADVVLANLNPSKGKEIGKFRPVIILTDTKFITPNLNLDSGMVFIVPLTSKLWKKLIGMRVVIEPRDNLLQTSYAVIEQARSIDISRINPVVLTSLSDTELEELTKKLLRWIGVSLSPRKSLINYASNHHQPK